MLIDSHAHLDLPEFDTDREEVIRRAWQNGLNAIITIGIDIGSTRQAIRIAQAHPRVFATAAIHPNESHNIRAGDIQELGALAQQPEVVAIGEIGLDFYRKYASRDQQSAGFRQQLSLAAELRKPVVIHSREAHRDTWEILSKWAKETPPPGHTPLRGIIHCFSGDAELGRKYVELGFLISIAGSVTYPKAVDRVAVAREIPLEKLLVETDSPFLAPQAYRGQRNEPSYVKLAAMKVAEARGLPLDKVADVTARNAIEVYNLTGL